MAIKLSFFLVLLVHTSLLRVANAFIPSSRIRTNLRWNDDIITLSERSSNDDDQMGFDSSPRRRSIIGQIISATTPLPLLSNSQQARSIVNNMGNEKSETDIPDLKCLLDLPPVDDGWVRVYLCRHGQTENNRLRLVQGARVDPPINQTGRKQAIRLGKALSYVKNQNSGINDSDSGNGGKFPTIIDHSSLVRARETATVASLIIGRDMEEDESSLSFINGVFSSYPISENDSFKPALDLRNLSSLGEVDFGSGSEGKPVNEARTEMMATYSQWAIGKLDIGSKGEGETGKSVLERVSIALNTLADIASSSGGSAIAVTHSTYLRMLLALVLDISLIEGAALTQNNCCINVLDLSMNETCTVGPKSNVFGGILSQAPDDFSLTFPKVKVIRRNENRHIKDLI